MRNPPRAWPHQRVRESEAPLPRRDFFQPRARRYTRGDAEEARYTPGSGDILVIRGDRAVGCARALSLRSALQSSLCEI